MIDDACISFDATLLAGAGVLQRFTRNEESVVSFAAIAMQAATRPPILLRLLWAHARR